MKKKMTNYKALISILLCVLAYNSAFASGDRLSCIEKESEALLRFKKGIVDEGGILSSWGSEEDKEECCKWEGIKCDQQTGHVVSLKLNALELGAPVLRGNISSALLELNYLNHLDLSSNDFGHEIPKFIGSLEKLQHLNFHNCFFSGVVPEEIGNLTNLRSLDLGGNPDLSFKNLDWLLHLSSLSLLDLSSSLFGNCGWLQDILNLPSLKELYLSSLNFCRIPVDFFVNSSSTPLSVLDLSWSELDSSSLHWLFNTSTSLRSISLSGNGLSANIPDDFERFTFLEHLDLSENYLTGGIPKSLGNLSHLQTLDLTSNSLSEPLVDFFYNNLSMGSFSSLMILKLTDNQFSGSFPDSIGQISSLRLLDLSRNHITGLLPNLTALVSLKELHLRVNKLKMLHKSLGQLSKLESLDVSSNSIEGTIFDAHFSKLHNLKVLDLSFNSLVLNFTADWAPPFRLDTINLASCKTGPHFPTWIRTQTKFSYLDLSSAGISDEVPKWLWDLSTGIFYFNLSHNQISGRIPVFSSKFVEILDISYNNFSGQAPLQNSYVLQLSNNMFLGAIPLVCTAAFDSLMVLDLSNNQFSGELPKCWSNMTSLNILNLSNNKLSGYIPHTLGLLPELHALQLRDNNISGELPSTLRNCNHLKMIDVGGNKLTGNIPTWIGTHLTKLRVLSIGQNNFTGSIPLEICYLNEIQILDLSRNSVSGRIPQCFSNFTSLVQKNSTFDSQVIGLSGGPVDISGFMDHALVQWKGAKAEYTKATLGFVKLIDLSSNRFVGNLPCEFSQLRALISLNLSRNYLSGNIVSNIGEMEMLECLDLSRNEFSGKIPIGLAELHYLGVLDLSNNNLSGEIPSSTQLQSFDPSSYAGNRELCGRPLTSCPGDDPNPSTNDYGKGKREIADDDDNDFIAQILSHEFYISITLGFIVGFWGVVGTLVLKNSWRIAYFDCFNRVRDWLYVTTTIYAARLGRS